MLAYGIMAGILFLLAAPLVAYSEVPEIIVEATVEPRIIESGDPVALSGLIVNHGYEPIEGAKVTVRAGSNTTVLLTGPDGTFGIEYAGVERIPATYTINVVVSWDGLSGFASPQFQVRGELAYSSALEEQLSTETAKRYLGANASDFEKNPIGMRLFEHYQKLYEELLEQQGKEVKTIEQIYTEQQIKLAERLRAEAISEFRPSNGTYGGYSYERYINGLNPEIRELVAGQLNFTKNTFENAQKVRDAIIDAGGTAEEAREAYLEMMAIPRETLEMFNRNATGVNIPANGTDKITWIP